MYYMKYADKCQRNIRIYSLIFVNMRKFFIRVFLKTDFAEKFYLKKKRHTVYRVPVFG